MFNKQVVCPGCGIKFFSRTNYVDKIFEKKSSHQVAVESFMTLGGQEVPKKPCIPNVEIRRLRAKLILEEALETIHALGFEPDLIFDKMDERFNPNLEQIVDGCCDLRVVTTGTLSACGVSDIRPQELVDENNLEKFRWPYNNLPNEYKTLTLKHIKQQSDMFVEVAVRDSNGKILKPPSHKPPEIQKELDEQTNRIN